MTKSFSFKKTDRILKRREFIGLSKSGGRVQNRNFIAVFCPGRFGQSRLGITVTKKVGNAVARNRIKRFTREFYRLNRGKIDGCWDINIIAKKRAATITTKEAFPSLDDLMGRISR